MKGIKYISHSGHSGYAEAAKAYVGGLLRHGVPVWWCPLETARDRWGRIIGNRPVAGKMACSDALAAARDRAIDYDVVVLHVLPEDYAFWADRERGKLIVGFTVWETNEIPAHWRECCAHVDLLVVPCEWNRRLIEQAGCKVTVAVLPHVFCTPEAPAAFPIKGARATDCVFYSIGTWSTRKANERLVEAFLEAFTADDAAVLVIKTTRNDLSCQRWGRLQGWLWRWRETSRRAVRKLQRRHPNPARVILLTRELTPGALEHLHARGDCYVSLTHAEGWGLGAFDAAGRGRPVIMTGFGGQTDVLPEQWAYLLPYRLVPARGSVMETGQRYGGSPQWAEANLARAAEIMRHVVNHRAEARERGAQLARHVRRNFNEAKVIRDLVGVIERRMAESAQNQANPWQTGPCGATI